MKKRLLTVVTFLLFSLSGCVNVVSSIEQVPEQYRDDYVYFHQIQIGMSRSDSYIILGDPGYGDSPLKVRWSVYEDDPMGGLEIIYIDDKVARLTFARFADPSFSFIIRKSTK